MEIHSNPPILHVYYGFNKKFTEWVNITPFLVNAHTWKHMVKYCDTTFALVTISCSINNIFNLKKSGLLLGFYDLGQSKDYV